VAKGSIEVKSFFHPNLASSIVNGDILNKFGL
jgi:hypothetical protein